jgi:hypothetical protein
VPPFDTLGRPRTRRVNDEFNGTALRKEWLVTDPENHFALGGGGLAFAPFSTPATFDQVMLTWSKRLAPLAGLTVEWAITFTAFGATAQDAANWGMDESVPALAFVRPGFSVVNTGALQVKPHSSAPSSLTTPVTLAVGVEYRFRIQFLPVGSAYLLSQDRGKSWQVVWVDTAAQNQTKLFSPAFDNRSATGTLWFVRWFKAAPLAPAFSDTFAARTAPGRADTGQPWLGVSGRALPVIAGDMRIPAGSTESWMFGWDGIGDGVWEGDLNFGSAPGATKSVWLIPRWRDGSNYLRVVFSRTNQNIVIARIANNVATTLATFSSAGFADNTTYKMRVVCIGPVIVAYQDGVEKLRVSEPFGQFFGLFGIELFDTLATPDIRWDNVRAWGTPPRPLLADSFDGWSTVQTTTPRPDFGSYTLGSDAGNPDAGVVAIGDGTGGGYLDAIVGTQAATGTYMYALSPNGRGGLIAWIVLRYALLPNTGVIALMLRYKDDNNFLMVFANGNNNAIVIRKRVAGVYSSVANVGFTFVSDRDYLLAVVVTGRAVEVWLDGARLTSGAYADNDVPGQIGLGHQRFAPSRERSDDLRFAPLGTVLVHDTFTRADSATTLGNTELPGTPWVPLAQGVGTTSTWGILTNRAYMATNTGGALYELAVVPTGLADVDVQAVVAWGANAGGVFGLALRCKDKDNVISFRLGEATDDLIVRKTVGGVSTTIASAAVTINTNTAYRLRVVVVGSLLKAYVNGVLLITVSETDLQSETQHGLFAQTSGSTLYTFDDFVVSEVAA